MNIVIIPFHDWRKILLEGSRTRDAHFIEEFSKQSGITIVVNRPTTALEIILKRKRNLLDYEVVLKQSCFTMYKISKDFYLIDYVSNNILSQVFNKHLWFVEQYGNKQYVDFITTALQTLGIENNYNLLSQNIFGYKLINFLKPKCSVFDAWDNFLKFEVYKNIKDVIKEGYNTYSKKCDFWITNSNDNIEYFEKPFKLRKIYLIKNGVDLNRFSDNTALELPDDMKNIPKPIIGFGGKITHLIDTELLNETMQLSRSVSFVFVGQILSKKVFDAIEKLDNFYYLGDKHYDDYPNYVKNFDICIVPYIVDEQKKSGANTIKVYEYLSTNKKVIGTNSNGLEDLGDYLYIIKNSKEFSEELSNIENKKEFINVEAHTWNYKLKQLIKVFNEIRNSKKISKG